MSWSATGTQGIGYSMPTATGTQGGASRSKSL